MRLFDDPQEQAYTPLVEARCSIPAVILLEGGYAIEGLGANVASFLHGFEQRGRLSGAWV